MNSVQRPAPASAVVAFRPPTDEPGSSLQALVEKHKEADNAWSEALRRWAKADETSDHLMPPRPSADGRNHWLAQRAAIAEGLGVGRLLAEANVAGQREATARSAVASYAPQSLDEAIVKLDFLLEITMEEMSPGLRAEINGARESLKSLATSTGAFC